MNYFFLTLAFYVLHLSNVQPLFALTLFDRTLFEANHISYTQRQLEAYFLCVDALKGAESPTPVNAQKWGELLDQYKIDALTDQEAIRIGSFDVTAKMLNIAMQLIATKRRASATYERRFASSQLSDRNLQRTVSQVLRVENFRRSKQKQAAIASEKTDPSALNLTTRMQAWQRELLDRSVVRLLDDATEYQPLVP